MEEEMVMCLEMLRYEPKPRYFCWRALTALSMSLDAVSGDRATTAVKEWPVEEGAKAMSSILRFFGNKLRIVASVVLRGREDKSIVGRLTAASGLALLSRCLRSLSLASSSSLLRFNDSGAGPGGGPRVPGPLLLMGAPLV